MAPLDPTRRAARAAAALTLLALPACSRKGELSDYMRAQQAQQVTIDALTERGAKFSQQRFPQGTAWAVDLSGQTVSGETLNQLKTLRFISELNLSKCQFADLDVGRLAEPGIGSVLLKLDLSQTAVTDADMEKLDGLGMLSQLNLAGTKVTPAAVERFRQRRKDNPKVLPQFKNPTIRLT